MGGKTGGGKHTGDNVMARITDDGMGNGPAEAQGDDRHVLSAEGHTGLDLPDSSFTKDAEIMRDGQDLVLRAPDGSVLVVEGYFSADPAPLLSAPDGTVLTPQLVDSFVAHAGPLQYAAADTATDESPVGAVKEVSGHAIVTHTDGSTETAAIGTLIYEGDVVETDAGGAVNIVFADESSFAISDNARMAIDEYVYDPASDSGATNVSMLRGMFMYTSGLIGREDPDDVHINTPMGSIGIRGTIIAGNVTTGEISVLEGAIVLQGTNGGEVTLDDQLETAKFNPATGGVDYIGVTDAGTFTQTYGNIYTVAPHLFSGVDSGTDQDGGGTSDGDAPSGNDSNDGSSGESGNNATDDQAFDSGGAPETDAGFDSAATGTDSFAETGNSFDGASEQTSETGLLSDSFQTGTDTALSGESGSGAETAAGGETSANSPDSTEQTDNSSTTTPPPPPPSGTSGGTVNAYAPVIGNPGAAFSVSENTIAGQIVGALTATDADGNNLTYSIVSGNAGNVFSISNTGVITVAGALDFENLNSYSLDVRVSDGQRTTDTTITVAVTDLDEAPAVSGGTVSFSENTAVSTSLYTVVATDPEGSALTYSITAGNGSGLFSINSATGEITLANPLDFETATQHNLTVSVSDGANAVNAAVTINVGDEDDTAPTMSVNTGAVVDEDGLLTITAALLEATDVDTSDGGIIFTLSAAPADGILYLNGTPLAASDVFTMQDILDGLVTYQHGGNENPSDSLSFSVSDGTNTPVTGQTFNITVTPNADATLPVNTGAAATEGGSIVIDDTMLEAIDADTADGNLVFTVTALPAYGTLYLNGTPLAASDTFTMQDVRDGLVSYDHDGSENFADGFNFSLADDDAGNTPVTGTFSVTVTPVNDAPDLDLDTGAGGTGSVATFTENGGPVDITGTVSALDSDDTMLESATATLTNNMDGPLEFLFMSGANIVIAASYGITVLGSGTDTITLTGSATLADYNTVLQIIQYDNLSDVPDTTDRTVDVVVNDGSVDSLAATATISVNAITDNDTLTGTAGNDIITGDDGDDTIVGDAGDDLIDGGAGIDTLDYAAGTGSIVVDLVSGGYQAIGGGFGNDNITNVENVIGTAYADTIYGNASVNILQGGGGDDTLRGGAGDTLDGGMENDTLEIWSPTDYNGINLDGGASNDTLYLMNSTGPGFAFDTQNFGSIAGIEFVDTTATATSSFVDFRVTGDWFANDTGDMTITIDADDTLNLDFSAYLGSGKFQLVSGNLTGAGSAEFYNSVTGNTLTVNYTAWGSTITQTGIEGLLDLNQMTGSPDGFWISDVLATEFGFSISSAGDSLIGGSADGFDDLLLVNGEGDMTYTLRGAASGAGTLSQGTAGFSGGMLSDATVSFIGDFNGDGVTDAVYGSPNADSSAAGSGQVSIRDINNNPILTLSGLAAGSEAGASVAGVGDVNNDGFADVMIGAPGGDGNAYILYGRPGGGATMDVNRLGTGVVNSLNTGSSVDSAYIGASNKVILLHAGFLEILNFAPATGAFSTSGSGGSFSGATALFVDETTNKAFVATTGGTVYRFDVAGGTPALDASVAPVGATGIVDLVVAGGKAYALTTGGKVFMINGAMSSMADGGTINQTGATVIAGAQRIVTDGTSVYVLYDGGGANDAGIKRIDTATTTNLPTDIVAAGGILDGAKDIAIFSGKAYVVTYDGGASKLAIVDLGTGNILSTIGAGMIPGLLGASDIDIRGNMLYIAADDGTTSGTVLAFDLSGDPVNPKLVGEFNGMSVDGAVDIIASGSGNPMPIVITPDGSIKSVDVTTEGQAFTGTTGSGLGANVSAAGDFDGDGFADFMYSVPGSGEVRIGFGHDSITAPPADVVFTGIAPSSGEVPLVYAGDVNGDGLSDVGILNAAGTGELLLFFGGHAGGGAGSANVTLTASAAYRIVSVGAAGDFNGDGYDDTVIVMQGWDGTSLQNNADIYVLYGRDNTGWSGFNGDLDDPANAFHITYSIPMGADPNDFDFTVTRAGDMNGDGFYDIAIGLSDKNMDGDGTLEGTAAVVYGREGGDPASNYIMGTSANDASLLALGANDIIVGGEGNDVMNENLSPDVIFRGGAGNDTIITEGFFKDIDGGSGIDVIQSAAATLDFSFMDSEEVSRIEGIHMTGASQTLTLSLENIFSMLRTSDTGTLTIDVDSGATSLRIETDDPPDPTIVQSEFAAMLGGTHAGATGGFDVFQVGGYEVKIDSILFTNGQVESV